VDATEIHHPSRRIASFSKESYLTMPMSQLYLFSAARRTMAGPREPISVVALATPRHLESVLHVNGKCFGSAPPPTMSASRGINGITASPTKNRSRYRSSSATTSRKPYPPPACFRTHPLPTQKSHAGSQDRHRRLLPFNAKCSSSSSPPPPRRRSLPPLPPNK